jgi:tetratricopeptide (TPR) repeat protein
MPSVIYRQLWLPAFAALTGLNSLLGAQTVVDSKISAADELRAARLVEAGLRNRQTSPQDWEKMLSIYAELAKKYPESPDVKNSYGVLLWEQGEREEAEKLWRNAVNQQENADSLAHLGTAALGKGEVKEAAACFTKAAALAPGDARLQFDLGNVLFLFRHELTDSTLPDAEAVIRRAMGHYAEACRLAPKNVDFARGRAETFYGLAKPDWKEALTAWQHLFDISPQKDFALANLATVHLKLGNHDEARACAAQMRSPEFAVRKARIMERIKRE